MSSRQQQRQRQQQQTKSDVLTLQHSEYAAQLFRTSLFSDCTIYSNHRVWHLHRCILSPRSEFFWRCLQGDFEEASSCSIEMHDDDPDTLGRMLLWIYTMRYPELQSDDLRKTCWTNDLMLYIMAEKYSLTELMEATRRALLDEAWKCADQPTRLLAADEDFVEAMRMVYEDLPEQEDLQSLRDELVQICGPVIARQLRCSAALQDLMTSIPAFGILLVESLAQEKRIRRRSSSSVEQPSLCKSTNADSNENSPRPLKYIPLNEDSEDEL